MMFNLPAMGGNNAGIHETVFIRVVVIRVYPINTLHPLSSLGLIRIELHASVSRVNAGFSLGFMALLKPHRTNCEQQVPHFQLKSRYGFEAQ